MNEYEKSFYQDINERKSLVPSSRHKKNGSKSRKASLPCDGLSKREWEKKNGGVLTVQMNKPMTYDEFKSIPLDLQERYVACLVDGYNVSIAHIARMMDVKRQTLDGYIRRNGFKKVKLRRGAPHLTEEQMRNWEEFLGKAQPSQVELSEDLPTKESPDTGTAREVAPEVRESGAEIFPSSFSLEFTGPITLDQIVRAVKRMYNLADAELPLDGSVRISFERRRA